MNKKDIVIISEFISAPFDEGLKNVLINLINAIKKKLDTIVLTGTENKTDGLDIQKIGLNKLFLNCELNSILKGNSPKSILYIPEASCTFNSFIRTKVLKLMCKGSQVVMLGAQHRTYSTLQAYLISKLLRPDLLFLLSRKNEAFYRDRGISVKVLPPAVDIKKFYPPVGEEKIRIRAKYNMPLNKKIVLHVGHIKANRNIEYLLEVQKLKETQVVIVGSTAFSVEENLKKRLIEAGIVVIDEYMPDISEAYKMSDLYVFPVMSIIDSIDMPLSILEAMACNLPVITTRFGGLTDYFTEDEGFKYFDSIDGLLDLLHEIKLTGIDNAGKVSDFSWDVFAEELTNSIKGLEC